MPPRCPIPRQPIACGTKPTQHPLSPVAPAHTLSNESDNLHRRSSPSAAGQPAGPTVPISSAWVGVLRRYSNRPDLLEQLRKVGVILSRDGHDGNTGAEGATETVIRSRRLRDRFSPEDLQAMIDLYRSGTTARQVAEKYGLSLRSVKRLLHQRGVRRYLHL